MITFLQLKNIIDIYLFEGRKLYCALIDYKEAYDEFVGCFNRENFKKVA